MAEPTTWVCLAGHEVPFGNRTCPTCSDERNAAMVARGEKEQTDARALWAVRVLDAWAASQGLDVFVKLRRNRDPGALRRWVVAHQDYTGDNGSAFYGETPDAARLAAARAVWPELRADVRAELGECP